MAIFRADTGTFAPIGLASARFTSAQVPVFYISLPLGA